MNFKKLISAVSYRFLEAFVHNNYSLFLLIQTCYSVPFGAMPASSNCGFKFVIDYCLHTSLDHELHEGRD